MITDFDDYNKTINRQLSSLFLQLFGLSIKPINGYK